MDLLDIGNMTTHQKRVYVRERNHAMLPKHGTKEVLRTNHIKISVWKRNPCGSSLPWYIIHILQWCYLPFFTLKEDHYNHTKQVLRNNKRKPLDKKQSVFSKKVAMRVLHEIIPICNLYVHKLSLYATVSPTHLLCMELKPFTAYIHLWNANPFAWNHNKLLWKGHKPKNSVIHRAAAGYEKRMEDLRKHPCYRLLQVSFLIVWKKRLSFYCSDST